MAEPEVLDVPPHEAIRTFRAKGFHIGYSWMDTDAATHMTSFTVAKAANLDILRDIRAAVDRALAEGVSYEDFRDELQPLLERRGWWGRREMRDPRTGETREVQLGSPRRLRTIFHTNLATAYARGKWERIERTAEDLPYLRYVAVNDERTRPDHSAWHGVILPVTDEWWRTHYPPNGWRCRCVVEQLSADDIERRGYEILPTRPAHEGQTRAWHNERTGEDVRVPIGVDPGWDHNVGRQDSVRAARAVLVEKIADAPVAVAQAAVNEGWDSYAAAGRAVRETISNAIPGAPGDLKHALQFRAKLVATLRARRSAGELEAEVAPALPGAAHAKAVATVREASRLFPRRWIEEANEIPLRAASGGPRFAGIRYPKHWTGRVSEGDASMTKTDEWALLVVNSESFGNAVHEYVHHLQSAMPGLDKLFHRLHRARTDGDPLLPIPRQPGAVGRGDQYDDEYFGREYPGWGPLEVMTMSFQRLFGDVWGKTLIHNFLRNDPRLADLAIGVLMRYDP